MAKGGGSSTQHVQTETSNLPAYAQPYFEGMMQRSQSLLSQPYTTYGQERIAGFTPEQQQVQQDILSQQTPGQFNTATNLTTAAGLGSLSAGQYNPNQFSAQQIGAPGLTQFSMSGPQSVTAQQYNAPQMSTAQTGYAPNLNYYQMQGPDSFTQQGTAQQFMSPYQQNVIDVQKDEAIRDAQKSQLVGDLGAARQGTYGGSRQLLAGLERERNLGQNLNNIQMTGLQSAYDRGSQQFNTEQQARQTAGAQNLQSALQTQQLGTQTGLQTSLANLSADSQSRVQNLAAQLQTQGLSADQALRAALANQQADLTTGQQNLQSALQTQQLGAQQNLAAQQSNQQYGLEAQRLAEQSRQFASQQGLAGLAQAGQMGQTLGNLGQYEQNADIARLNQQTQTAAQQQAMQQQYMDTAYQDFLRQRDYPLEMLQQYSSLLRGVPVTPNSTTTTYAPQPGIAQQLLGTGLGAASIYNAFAGG